MRHRDQLSDARQTHWLATPQLPHDPMHKFIDSILSRCDR